MAVKFSPKRAKTTQKPTKKNLRKNGLLGTGFKPSIKYIWRKNFKIKKLFGMCVGCVLCETGVGGFSIKKQ